MLEVKVRFSLFALIFLAALFLGSTSAGVSVASASTQTPITGDADCNLSVDEVDALGIARVSAGVATSLECAEFADVNCDGATDILDMIELLRYSAGLEPIDLPSGCPQIGSATGLPDLILSVDTSVEVKPAEIAGIDGGPARPLAAVVDDDGLVSRFVANELVLVTNNTSVLNNFLTKWNATLVITIDPADANIGVPQMHLIRLDTSSVDLDALADDLRALHGNSWGQFDVSSVEAMGLLAVAAGEAADGLSIDVNWVAEGGGNLDQREYAEASHGPTEWSPNPFDWPYMNRGSNQDIGVADAWRALGAHGKLGNRIGVSIMDGGFAPNPDFPAGYDMNGPANVENPASCTDDSPCPWHGTVVTAAAMGVPDNGYGVAGPAGPIADASLTQSPSLDLFSILRYVFISLPGSVVPLPDVLNISAGVNIPRELCLTGICLAIDGVTAGIRGLGVLLFAAAMNDGTNVDELRCIDLLLGEICYEKTTHVPCEAAFVVCVGGLNWDATTRSKNSNYGTDNDPGQTVDIFGPMVQFTTPTPIAGIERRNCGTSCASPFVAGVAALIMAANPSMSAGEAEDILLVTAHTDSGDVNVPRWVNAYGGVIMALGGNEPPELDIELDSGTYTGGMAFRLSAHLTDPEDLPFAGGWTGLPAISWTSSIDGAIGNQPLTSPVLLSYGTHLITAVATDSGGLSITDTRTWTIVNHPPVVNLQTPLPNANLFDGQQVLLRGTSSDQNRASGKLEDSEVQWFTAPSGDPTNRSLLATGHTVTVTLDLTPGDYLLTFKGTDEAGASDEESVTIHVAPTPLDFPPVAQITNFDPSNNCVHYGFTGTATDHEDGTLSGASLAWYRSVNGGPEQFFGNGASVQMSTSGLVNGDNVRVILRATDSASNTGEDFYDFNHACLL